MKLSDVLGFDQNKFSKMKIVFGLGNPGIKYKNQRHNVGMSLCEFFCNVTGSQFKKIKTFSFFEISSQLGAKYFFVKPEAFFMNDSGKTLKDVMKYFSLNSEEILLVHDELELKFDAIKFGEGSAKGHNGVKSVFNETGCQDFYRLKIGIGRPTNKEDVPSYVLTNFSSAEEVLLKQLFLGISDCFLNFMA